MALARLWPGPRPLSGVQLFDLLFASLDEGIDGGTIAACHGSEDGSVDDDPFVGFGDGIIEFRFGLSGVAIFSAAGAAEPSWPSCFWSSTGVGGVGAGAVTLCGCVVAGMTVAANRGCGRC